MASLSPTAAPNSAGPSFSDLTTGIAVRVLVYSADTRQSSQKTLVAQSLRLTASSPPFTRLPQAAKLSSPLPDKIASFCRIGQITSVYAFAIV